MDTLGKYHEHWVIVLGKNVFNYELGMNFIQNILSVNLTKAIISFVFKWLCHKYSM